MSLMSRGNKEGICTSFSGYMRYIRGAMADRLRTLDLCSDGCVVRMWVRIPGRVCGTCVSEQDTLL